MLFLTIVKLGSHIIRRINYFSQICPEMQLNEMHALYDKRYKVFPFL